MTRFFPILVFLCFCPAVLFSQEGFSQERISQENEWVELFNGKDFTGWIQKNGTAKYTIEEGGIICGTTQEGSPNSFLCTEKEYGNFELEFQVKVANELNSGVQIRSQTRQPTPKEIQRGDKFGRVNGPQVEIEASGSKGAEAGYIYGEAAGGWLTSPEDLIPTQHFKDGQWNSYRILANGPSIKTWINDQPVASLNHEGSYASHPSGFIGLQVHSIKKGLGPFEVRWKDIRIRELPPTPPAQIKHAFVGAGRKTGIVMVDENGVVQWQMNLPASDVWMLSNGNFLAAIYPCNEFPRGGVAEIEQASRKLIWQYQGQQKEISTVEQIGENEYLVAELGDAPRAIVINRAGEVLSEMPFQCQSKNAHMQTRMLRRLPNGNYIAPHLFDFAVKEYKPKTGKVVKVIKTDDRGREKKDWPFTAIRLKGNRTLIGCTNGNRVIEVDRKGEIVWSISNEDLPEPLIDDACGVQRLSNGNTVITSYHASGDRVKLLEVTPDKKVVWKFDGLDSGFHHFQILTSNGIPITKVMK
ncbi:MAG: DUF1080 domain-containing protein [Planctomycetota bacterium]